MELLGTSRVSDDNKITVIRNVARILNISKGNIVGFYRKDGKIVLEKVNIFIEETEK